MRPQFLRTMTYSALPSVCYKYWSKASRPPNLYQVSFQNFYLSKQVCVDWRVAYEALHAVQEI